MKWSLRDTELEENPRKRQPPSAPRAFQGAGGNAEHPFMWKSHRRFPDGKEEERVALRWGNCFFPAKGQTYKDDIYIFLKPLLFSLIISRSPRPFHSAWNVCTQLMILSPNTSHLHKMRNAFKLLRLLIPAINVTLCVTGGVAGPLI